MTDNLQTKFDSVQSQMTSETSAILTAMGALSDIKTGVDDANTAINTGNADFSSFASSLLTNLATMSANMTNGFRDVVNATNALYCPCSTDGPLIPVPPATTPTEATQAALCQRIQYFIDLYRIGVLVNASAYVASAGIMSGISASILQANALTERSITTGEIAAGMPTATQSGVASAWNNYIAAVGAATAQANVFAVANDLLAWSTIRDALSISNNSSDGYAGFVTAIAAMGWDDGVKAIVSSGFYSAWLNDIYSAVPVVDASAYDGSACALPPLECADFTSVATTASNGFNGEAIATPPASFTSVAVCNTSSGSVTWTQPCVIVGDMIGWTVRNITGSVRILHRPGGVTDGSFFSVAAPAVGASFTLPTTGTVIIDDNGVAGGHFQVEICPPAS